jgi:phosphoserine phosphatase RsbU/P
MDEINALKKQIELLQLELSIKNSEILKYQTEFIKLSSNLDLILSTSQQDIEQLNLIQSHLIPTELPQFPGFEISRKFSFGTQQGGDYFDLFSFTDKMKCAVLLSSSSSYTMSASFLSIVLQNSSRFEGKSNQSIDEIINETGTELLKLAQPQDETQLFYGIFDRRQMTLQFCCVGKIKAVLLPPLNSDELAIKILSSASLGFKQDRQIKAASIQLKLQEGQRICLISEGLLNVLDESEVVEIAKDTLSGTVHELRNQLFVKAQIKSGFERPLKDQTVIVIELKKSIVKLA